MSISHSILGRVLAVGLLAGYSASSWAAIFVTGGTGTTRASSSGNYNLPGVYVGSVSGSDSYQIILPGSESHTTNSPKLLPPEVYNNPGIVAGSGTSKLTVNTLLGGVVASGQARSSESYVLGVGGGSGSAGFSIDVFFTITNSPGVLNANADGETGTGASASLMIFKDGDTVNPFFYLPPGWAYDDLSMVLNPGNYEVRFGVGSSAGAVVDFQLSVVPEIPSISMMSVAFFTGAAFIAWRRRSNLSVTASELV